MQSDRDTYVLVPDAARSAMLVHQGGLPRVTGPHGALAGAIELLEAA